LEDFARRNNHAMTVIPDITPGRQTKKAADSRYAGTRPQTLGVFFKSDLTCSGFEKGLIPVGAGS
jgi:hypothetical protein